MTDRDWQFDIRPLTSPESAGALWQQVENSSNCSFFQSWIWVSAWLKTLPKAIQPLLLTLRKGNQVTAIAVGVSGKTVRRGVVWSRCLYFGETGDEELDAITVEYGGPLICSGHLRSAPQEFLKQLRQSNFGWDEICLPGLDQASMEIWTKTAAAAKLRVRMTDQKPGFTVDLSRLHGFEDYIASLSSNSRQQLRRAIRGYERHGPITVTEAVCQDDVSTFFSNMKELHQSYWKSKSRRGAFGNSFQNIFHDEVVRLAFRSDHLQLLRFRSGDSDIGYLYNFLWRDTAYAYQSGFDYSLGDAKLKPGFVCHGLAIDFNRKKGVKTYDFLAGDSRYKHSLSTNSGRLSWLVLQKSRVRFKLENQLSRVWHDLQGSVTSD